MGQLIAGYVLAPLFVLGGLALAFGLLAGSQGMVGILLVFALPVAYLSGLFIGCHCWPTCGQTASSHAGRSCAPLY